MATREKKPPATKKPSTSSPVPPPSDISTEAMPATAETVTVEAPLLVKNPAARANKASARKQLVKNPSAKKLTKKPSISLKLKSKIKKPNVVKPKTQKVIKSILTNPKNAEAKKALIRQGKPAQPRKRNPKPKAPSAVEKPSGEDIPPPVLEPIFPLDANVDAKDTKKKPAKAPKIDNYAVKKVKTETVTTAVKRKRNPKPKPQPPPQPPERNHIDETIDDVMKDLTSLIKSEPFESEPVPDAESVEQQSTKPKKRSAIRKPKKKVNMDEIRAKLIKFGLGKICYSKLTVGQRKLIDMLDLNVRKIKKTPPKKRRHSIAKVPASSSDGVSITTSIFSTMPRSLSPRSKTLPRVRHSIDGFPRRINPYKTRSDSPARILRNGKLRKLNELGLLDVGLVDSSKRRKRHCSDLSGSEMSKLSGYESDSSFSDMSSLHGADTSEIKTETRDHSEEVSRQPEATILATIKRSRSTDTENMTDTNSNVCADINGAADVKEEEPVSPSLKVPEKSLILDIMKQTFNDEGKKPRTRAKKQTEVPSATFYGPSTTSAAPEPAKAEEKMEAEAINETEPEAKSMEAEPNKKIETLASKKIEPAVSRKIEPEASKKIEPEASKKIEPEASKKVEPEASKKIEPQASKRRRTEASKRIEPATSKKIEPVTSRKIEPVTGKKIEPEASKNVEVGANKRMEAEAFKEVETEAFEELETEAFKELEIEAFKELETEAFKELETETFKELETETFEEMETEAIKEVETGANMEEEEEEEEEEKVNGHEVPKADEVSETNGSSKPNGNAETEPIRQVVVEETPENMAIKENILQALGLFTIKAAQEAKEKASKSGANKTGDFYTGTLKTVIKLPNRDKKKGGGGIKRNPLKMTLQQKYTDVYDVNGLGGAKDGPQTSWKQGGQSSDTTGAHRKTHYSNRSNMEESSEQTDGEADGTLDGKKDKLLIPEKVQFHGNDKDCDEVCSYCMGKFGLYDTPLHIAQIKSEERQAQILSLERLLNKNSCLCDACFRHIDRKSSNPNYMNKPNYHKRSVSAPPPSQDFCHVLGCDYPAHNILRRKWIIKMKKNILDVIMLDLDNPGLHSIPICDEHYNKLEHLMVCAMCKRRLAKNHVFCLGPEAVELNKTLHVVGVPISLGEKPVICKLCKTFANLFAPSTGNAQVTEEELEEVMQSKFFYEYKRRLLHFNDIERMDEAEAEEPISVPTITRERPDIVEPSTSASVKRKRKAPKSSNQNRQSVPGDQNSETQVNHEVSTKQPASAAAATSPDQNRVPSTESVQSRPESPSDYMIDYNTLIPSIAMDCGSDSESKKDSRLPASVSVLKRIPRPETVKQAVEISKMKNKTENKTSDIAVQRLGSNPSISVRQLFPCEEDLPLQTHVDFGNIKETTVEGWEKCTSIIQYDVETKQLWQELQKPYGNQSSFLRHLILLEKYFRNGDLVLAPNASHHSLNYSMSVQNRLRAYDCIPSNAGHVQPISMLQFNSASTKAKSNSGIITSTNSIPKESPPSISLLNAANIPKNTPITISQLNSPPLIPAPPPIPTPVAAAPPPPPPAKKLTPPPGLIQLRPGTSKPLTSLVNKPPQAQKIKFPLSKNWRPTLIPLDPAKKTNVKKPGLIQVISNGKPYHITLEDYKKMCAIKKNFELKNKRMTQETGFKKLDAATTSTPKAAATSPKKSYTILKQSRTDEQPENSLEKLDRQVEKLEAKLNEKPPVLNLPKIPKSLTVIPQTVPRKPSRPSSPILMITPKPKQISNKS